MRLRLLRNVRMAGSSSVELLAGSVVNTTPDVAEKWQKQGLAMEDKSLDGGSGMKVETGPPEPRKPLPPDYVNGEVSIERKIRHKRKHGAGIK